MDNRSRTPGPHTLLAGRRARRRWPINLRPADRTLFEPMHDTEIPPAYLLHLKNVRVSSKGYLFQGRRLLAESFASARDLNLWKRTAKELKFWAAFPFRQRTDCPEPALWITDNWSSGYFHWMTDSLPRLLATRSVVEESTLLLPAHFQPLKFVEPSLAPFQIKTIHYLRPGEVCRCPRLLLPTPTAPTGDCHEELVHRLRTIYAETYRGSPLGLAGDRVYISRAKAGRRKIANEDAVHAVFKEHGFETIYCEDLSFEEQVRIARQTRYLVSNHGAGLTNMLYMAAGGSVLELRRVGDSHNNCYFSLASALGLKYYYQTCAAENSQRNAHVANLVVDVAQSQKNLRLMLSPD